MDSQKKFEYRKNKNYPLTAYAKSKVIIENYLKNNFKFNSTCLRFATACGGSSRLRIDLVLNDFVASAIKKKKIILNSTGDAYRPLIDVKDIYKSIHWSMRDRKLIKKKFICLNVGNSKNNFKIIDLAKKSKKNIKNMQIITNDKNKDNRSYKASFSQYQKLAKKYPINYNVNKSILDLNKILKNFPKSKYDTLIRLNYLKKLINQNIISKNLKMIEGVEIKNLKKIADERGAIFHMLKKSDANFKQFGEIYFATAYPGVVKNFTYILNKNRIMLLFQE